MVRVSNGVVDVTRLHDRLIRLLSEVVNDRGNQNNVILCALYAAMLCDWMIKINSFIG